MKKPLPHKFEDAGVQAYQCSCGAMRFIVRSDKKIECPGCNLFVPYTAERKKT